MAKSTKTVSSLETVLNEFWNLFETKDSSAAVDYIFKSNPWMADKKESIKELKQQLADLIQVVGKYYGHEALATKGILDRYELRSFFVCYDRQPIRFTFLFYRSNEKWALQNFNFDSSMDDELRKSAVLNA